MNYTNIDASVHITAFVQIVLSHLWWVGKTPVDAASTSLSPVFRLPSAASVQRCVHDSMKTQFASGSELV